MRIGPGYESVDVFGEVAIGEADEEIAQVGVWFNAVHLACADQAGETGPITAAFIMAGKESIAAVHGWTSDRVFDGVGVDVDAAVIQEQPQAVLAFQHMAMTSPRSDLRVTRAALSCQPGEELVH